MFNRKKQYESLDILWWNQRRDIKIAGMSLGFQSRVGKQ